MPNPASDLRLQVQTLRARAVELQRDVDRLIADRRRNAAARIALSGVLDDKFAGDGIDLGGLPSQRLRISRRQVGEPVEYSFARSLGISRSVTEAPDVRTLWEQLLHLEHESDSILRGGPATVLDVPGAVVARSAGGVRIEIGPQDGPVVAVPRFTYAFPERKLRNFGHWLLDCVPHAGALAQIAPDARLLLPSPTRAFYLPTLALAGISPGQCVEWDGAPVPCSRLLLMQHDGRTGGGRPLSLLAGLRRRVAAPVRGRRRIYVSRRDARSKRQWVSNEQEVEAVFQRHGFDILLMADRTLDEQIALFQDAAIVAGISGAGLTDLLFAADGTRVIVLVTDSLVRWYAEQGARALWATGARGGAGQLAALGDSPRFYPHLAAAFSQTSHTLLSPDDVPLAALSQFVEDVLREAQ